ncbi:MAG TPA: hypothetical protein VHE83_01930 [Mycobacteriales bacterium]|nr:hypothetical protein [Mycobacteriales bacterium]
MRSTYARRMGVSVLVAGVALSTVAACGSSKKSDNGNGSSTPTGAAATGAGGSAQATFTSAVAKVTSGDSATVTLRLGATEAQLKAFASETGQNGKLPSDTALALLTGGSITFATHAEAGDLKTAATTGKTDYDFAINAGGGPILEFRYLSGSKRAFIKLDVPKIATLSGKTVPPAIAQYGKTPQFSFLQDALAGKWLELQGLPAIIQQFSTLAGGASAPASPAAGASGDVASKLLSTLTADVAATDAGSTDKGEHLVLAAPLQKLAADLQSITASVPGGSLAGSRLTKLNDVPNRTVNVDAYVKDGALTTLSLDIVQFAPADKASTVAGQHLPIELDFASTAGDTGAPSGATPVDLSKLAAQFGPLLAGQLGSAGG